MWIFSIKSDKTEEMNWLKNEHLSKGDGMKIGSRLTYGFGLNTMMNED